MYQANVPQVVVSVSLNNNTFHKNHNLLNEARLSALALSIYLAAAKVNAAKGRSGLKILALDDVLIGLDMSNRLPVLDVLQGTKNEDGSVKWEGFSDWQIFLFTYDRAWYELAKSRLGRKLWKHFAFYSGGEVPVWAEDCGALEKSKKYREAAKNSIAPDYKAAGVWARSAFEWMMKWFCDKHSILITYGVDDKFLSAETLWKTLQKVEVEILTKAGKDTHPLIREEIGEGVTRAKSQHLNPLCHANLNLFESKEIVDSIEALEALKTELERDYHAVRVPEQLRIEVPVEIIKLDLEGFTKAQLAAAKKQIADKLSSMR